MKAGEFNYSQTGSSIKEATTNSCLWPASEEVYPLAKWTWRPQPTLMAGLEVPQNVW